MIVENIGENCFKPRSGDINLSCLRHFNAFSSDLAIILSCLRHYHLNYFSTLDAHYLLMSGKICVYIRLSSCSILEIINETLKKTAITKNEFKDNVMA